MFLVRRISAEDWKAGIGEDAHAIAFQKRLTPDMERLDYALLCIEPKTNSPVGYVTVRELNEDSVYWRFGGAFPILSKVSVLNAFCELINWSEDKGIKRISFLVENNNKPMLKLAMASGFKIIGIRNYNGIFLEHLLEL